MSFWQIALVFVALTVLFGAGKAIFKHYQSKYDYSFLSINNLITSFFGSFAGVLSLIFYLGSLDNSDSESFQLILVCFIVFILCYLTILFRNYSKTHKIGVSLVMFFIQIIVGTIGAILIIGIMDQAKKKTKEKKDNHI